MASPQTDTEPDAAPEGSVHLSIKPLGDVNVSIYADSLSQQRLQALRTMVLPCNWRAEEQDDGYLIGACHAMLHSDGASVDGRIPLAGLVVALRASGLQVVRLSVQGYAPFRASPGDGWYVIRRKSRGKRFADDDTIYFYTSRSINELPAYADIRVGIPWKASRFVTPLAFTLLGPPLLALWLRRRSERKGGRPATVVWMNWVMNGMFLYWISALSISDLTAFTYRLRLESAIATLAVGALVYSIPPLASVLASVFLIHPANKRSDAIAAARRAAVQNATLLVPLGIFLVGGGMFQLDARIAMGSVLAAYAAFKMLTVVAARVTHGNIQLLTQGDLCQKAYQIAGRAGVKLHGFYLTDNRAKREANAFAAGTGVVMVSRGLVENLTRREVDAVLAHETGHLRGKHTLMTAAAFWAYILLVQPLVLTMAVTAKVPQWVLGLPILPVAFIMGTAYLSRGREFNADKRAAELTGDPEGVIAGLARLRILSDSPVDWGGMQGSILSHPSMQARVLAIARHCHLDEIRALAVLHDPDILGAEPAPTQNAAAEVRTGEAAPAAEVAQPIHYELPERSVVFSTFAKEGRALPARWVANAVLVAELLAVAVLMERIDIPWPWGFLASLAGLALATRTFLAVDNVLSCYFLKRIRRKLEREWAGAGRQAMFVGVLPGWRVMLPDGFPIWDVGFLSFSPDYLTYEGEQTRFSVPREAVTGVAVQKGPLAWDPEYVLTVAWQGGAFSLTRPDRGTTSRRQARRLEAQLRSWWHGEPLREASCNAVNRLPAPALPQLSGEILRGWKAVRVLALRAAMLFFGTIILVQALQMKHYGVMLSMAPICLMLAVCPIFFRKAPAA
jgi:Zn-dependent protease with chaperone function